MSIKSSRWVIRTKLMHTCTYPYTLAEYYVTKHDDDSSSGARHFISTIFHILKLAAF